MRTQNNSYDSLAGLGSINKRNRLLVKRAKGQVGVVAETAGAKKATVVELYIPTSRSRKESRRVTKIELDGAQARALFETLSRFYDSRPE